MTHAPAVVKSPNGGTSQSLIGEINSQTSIRARTTRAEKVLAYQKTYKNSKWENLGIPRMSFGF